jgi:hypothetical protein
MTTSKWAGMFGPDVNAIDGFGTVDGVEWVRVKTQATGTLGMNIGEGGAEEIRPVRK